MKRIVIDLDKIADKEAFHDYFDSLDEFPDHYGKNMDAWIDVIEDLSEKSLTISISSKEPTHLIENKHLLFDILDAITFVNTRKHQAGRENYILAIYTQ